MTEPKQVVVRLPGNAKALTKRAFAFMAINVSLNENSGKTLMTSFPRSVETSKCFPEQTGLNSVC
jgi:hypothetical protein